MSQGDPTFNATAKISKLLAEFKYHAGRRGEGEILDVIAYLRRVAEYDEANQGWNAASLPEMERLHETARGRARQETWPGIHGIPTPELEELRSAAVQDMRQQCGPPTPGGGRFHYGGPLERGE